MLKLLIAYIAKTKPVLALRDLTGIKRPIFYHDYCVSYSASDKFIWRTDRGFETIFKTSRLSQKFFGVDDFWLFFIFYDADGKEISRRYERFDSLIFRLRIDSQFIGYEGVGSFSAFHIPTHGGAELQIINRCYVGYGRNSNFSMVHGNIVALFIALPFKDDSSIKTALNPRSTKTKFYIQRSIKPVGSYVLGVTNPLDRKISLKTVCGQIFHLPPLGTRLIELNVDEGIAPWIEADFLFPRPVMFSSTGTYYDCHHC